MGYTTQFDGVFTLDRLPYAETIVRLRLLENVNGQKSGDPKMPSSYNEWELTKDCMGLQWIGGEKFYYYVEWLQYLIDTIIKPANLTFTGTIHYAGANVKDTGWLKVEDGVVKQIPLDQIDET